LTCPLVLLTLGLFVFVLNGLMLWLTGWVAAGLGLGFEVGGLLPAILGGLVVGAVSTVLNVFVRDDDEREKD
jgi:putative membrane protein